ncbi:MAG: two-component regulator propeller domain-containing protein [Candidatus Brocadiia bacterium]
MKRKMSLAIAVICFAAAAGLADGKWKHITKEDGLPGDEIQLLLQDKQGKLWIGTGSGLALRQGDGFKVYLEKKRIWDMVQIDKNRFWIGTRGGVMLLQDGETKHLFKGHTVAPIVHYRKNVFWAIGKNPGTQRNILAGGTTEGWEPIEPFKGKKVVDLFRQNDGTIWVAEDGNGVYRIEQDKGPEEAKHHLSGFNVTVISQDSKGGVWCGVWGRGVRVFRDGKWTGHLADEETYVFDIEEDAEGHVWVATNSSGLWEYDGKDWESHLREEGQINMLATTSDGRVWISTQMLGGLRYWDGKKWQFALDNRLPFRCLLETNKGDVWAGSVLGGVFVLE